MKHIALISLLGLFTLTPALAAAPSEIDYGDGGIKYGGVDGIRNHDSDFWVGTSLSVPRDTLKATESALAATPSEIDYGDGGIKYGGVDGIRNRDSGL